MNEPTTQGSAEPTLWRQAYESVIEEIKKVPDDKLVVINFDVPAAVSTVLGALPEIRALRPRIVTEAPMLDIVQFDKLESYALALAHAHLLYKAASEPAMPLEALAEEATELREVLLADATALARRGLLDGDRLHDLKGVKGHRNLAFDLGTLATLLREAWPKISAKTAVELNELERAERVAARIVSAVGQREQAPAVVATSAANRQRAFTLFFSAYDQVRRAVHFLRWDREDAESIAPSLYAATRGPRRKSDEGEPTDRAKSGLPTKVNAPAVTEKPVTGAAPSPMSSVGMPDSEPFME